MSLKDLTGGKDLEVTTAGNGTYVGMGKRGTDCELNMVGKPVFNRYSNMLHGAWLRDPILKENVSSSDQKVWVTKENETNHLYEFNSKDDFVSNKMIRDQPYKLACPFKVRFVLKFRLKIMKFKKFLRVTLTLFTTPTFITFVLMALKSFALT